MLHQRHPPVDRSGDREVMVRNLPKQRHSSYPGHFTFLQARNLSEAIQNQTKALTASVFGEKLSYPRSAPQRSNVGGGNHHYRLRQVANQPGYGIDAGGEVHYYIAEVRSQ